MAEYMIASAGSSVRLPDSMTFEQACPATCAGATIYQAILRAGQEGLKPGGVLGIVGIGALGHIGTQHLQLRANVS